jgi:hypothetical protein
MAYRPSCALATCSDARTVTEVLGGLQERFGLRHVVFVGDRGVVTPGNLDWLRAKEQGYLVGLKRRRQPEILRYLQGATGTWLECPAGISASEKFPVPKTWVQEVASVKVGLWVFVVHSEERLEYERSEGEKAIEGAGGAGSTATLSEPRQLKAPEKIGATGSRALSRHHGYRYAWELKQGKFRYFEHAQNLQQEKAVEGKYITARRRGWKRTSSSPPWHSYWTAR